MLVNTVLATVFYQLDYPPGTTVNLLIKPFHFNMLTQISTYPHEYIYIIDLK